MSESQNKGFVRLTPEALPEGVRQVEEFTRSNTGSIGIELELMLLDPLNFELMPIAEDVLSVRAMSGNAWDAKPEITKSMLEVSTGIIQDWGQCKDQIGAMAHACVDSAWYYGAKVSGGGIHPVQNWTTQRIFPKDRYLSNLKKYGYLSKLFTVFGMHVHVGVQDADEAIWMTQHLTQKAPLFIALSACSPYNLAQDTEFASCRSNVVSAFPMSGQIGSHLRSWSDFERFYEQLYDLGAIRSIKDLYWDVRPKPEYGTVEVRVIDTPLRAKDACAIAWYIKALALSLHHEYQKSKLYPTVLEWAAYSTNRFQAAKWGLEAQIVRARDMEKKTARQWIEEDLEQLSALHLEGFNEAKERLLRMLNLPYYENMRSEYQKRGSISDVGAFMVDEFLK